MACIEFHIGMHLVEDFSATLPGAEKIHVLPPPKSHHHPDAKFISWSPGTISAERGKRARHSCFAHHGEVNTSFLGGPT